MNSTERVLDVFDTAKLVANFLFKTGRIHKAIELSKERLILLNKMQMSCGLASNSNHTRAIENDRMHRRCDEKYKEAILIFERAQLYQDQRKYHKAKDLYMEALSATIEFGDKDGESSCYGSLATVFLSLTEYDKAEEYLQKVLQIKREIGDKDGEATCYGNLGSVFQSLGEYVKAEEYLQKAVQIKREIGNKIGEARCYGNIGKVFRSLGEFVKAEKYLQRALQIEREIGDKHGEAASCTNLGTVFQSLGEYAKAEEYLQKALQISREIGDKREEAASCANLGNVFRSLGEYAKAEEYLQKALQISREIGETDGEATCYGNLGSVFQSLGEFVKAEKYLQKALEMQRELGDKDGEATSYANLGTVFESLAEYVKAEEYLQKALQINRKIGDKYGEATCYGNLGNVFRSLGKYVKAEEYLQKALQISKEIGDKGGEAIWYGNLGTVFTSLGEYVKAKEYHQKALHIQKEIGDKDGETVCYGNLGNVFQSLGEYVKAEEYLQEALQIQRETGNKHGEATSYGNLGTVFTSLGKYVEAKNCCQKSLVIIKEIGDKRGEASCYLSLGDVFFHEGEYFKAKENHEKALALSYESGCIDLQLIIHLSLAWDTLWLTGNMDEAVSSLFSSIEKCEKMRIFLKDNDQFKISFLDKYVSPYKCLSAMFLKTAKFNEALCVQELGRARALADLMSTQYSLEQQPSVNSRSWFNIEKIGTTESNCACLYISYCNHEILLWVIKADKTIHFRLNDPNDCFGNKQEGRSVDRIFDDITFRTFHFPPTQEHCEDRSLFPSNDGYVKETSSSGEGLAVFRPVEEDDDESQYIDPPNLSQCYKMIISPVANLLVEPEIIIVPDRVLCKVPFSAFKDENEKYLSETFRIRIVPSLTTLRLIQESPEDYHSQTDVLIVGEPKVGEVYHKGRREKLCPLPGAKEEAEMIARLLGDQPLLGEHATKEAVLQRIHSVGLIHFAAHGDAERGEIALAPPLSFEGIPTEDHYLLTMAEISQVRLRAKLVVLSCCHSARGQIRSEGVVGIARAFLGSGARSVLVALWAIEDLATKQFMSSFYEHLVRGESASESLHQTMKWMRGNGFSKVVQWAPFMLIGDNVTFDFGK